VKRGGAGRTASAVDVELHEVDALAVSSHHASLHDVTRVVAVGERECPGR
jgi:hypothetical protein